MEHREPPPDPYELRPEERTYLLGWILFIPGGIYLIYRGILEQRLLLLLSGSLAILLGASQTAVIAVRSLRPWRKLVRVAWLVVVLLFFIVMCTLDIPGYSILP